MLVCSDVQCSIYNLVYGKWLMLFLSCKCSVPHCSMNVVLMSEVCVVCVRAVGYMYVVKSAAGYILELSFTFREESATHRDMIILWTRSIHHLTCAL